MFLSNRKYNQLSARIDEIDSKVSSSKLYTTSLFEKGKKDLSNDLETLEKKKVAYALNLCTVSVSQIIDYNDLYILEQEYDAILNNLNLQNFIKDEALLKVLKQILDTVTFFKIQEGDRLFIEKEYQHKMKNAIWSAVPNLSVILAGGSPVQMAITMATQVGIGYMNYRKNKNQYILDNEKQEWELQRSATEQFHGLRRELFETAWRLSDVYDFDDVFRLTEKQISHYNTILLDPDPLRRYEKLNSISSTFEAFPPFWYFKGNAAREVYCNDAYREIRESFKQKAIDAFRTFDEIYVNFMREDVLAASCALEHISLLDITTHHNEIVSLLERATSLAGDNFDVLQMCVLIHASLNQLSEAKQTLRRLVNEEYNLGLNGLLLSRIYCKFDKNKSEYTILRNRIGESNVMPWIEDDKEADMNYIEFRKKSVIWRFDSFADKFTEKYQNKLKYDFGNINSFDKPSKIDWFIETDVVYLIINSLNQMFTDLSHIPLFRNPKDYGLEITGFFETNTNEIDKLLKDYYAQESIVRTHQINSDRIHRFFTNHEDNIEMCEWIDKLLKQIDKLYSTFSNNLKKDFENMFTVKTAVLIDTIINEIDLWYIKNKISIPVSVEIDKQKNLLSIPEVFFDYAEYKTTKK